MLPFRALLLCLVAGVFVATPAVSEDAPSKEEAPKEKKEAPPTCETIVDAEALDECTKMVQGWKLKRTHIEYSRFLTVFFGDLKVRGNAGYTNFGGTKWGGAITTASLDRIEAVGDVRIGWIDKPILRDLYFSYGSDADVRTNIENYVGTSSRSETLKKVLVLDALKLNLTDGYGSVLKDPEGDDNFEATQQPFFAAVLSYDVPLTALMQVACKDGEGKLRPICGR